MLEELLQELEAQEQQFNQLLKMQQNEILQLKQEIKNLVQSNKQLTGQLELLTTAFQKLVKNLEIE